MGQFPAYTPAELDGLMAPGDGDRVTATGLWVLVHQTRGSDSFTGRRLSQLLAVFVCRRCVSWHQGTNFFPKGRCRNTTRLPIPKQTPQPAQPQTILSSFGSIEDTVARLKQLWKEADARVALWKAEHEARSAI